MVFIPVVEISLLLIITVSLNLGLKAKDSVVSLINKSVMINIA